MSALLNFFNAVKSVSFYIAISVDIIALLIAYYFLISDALKDRSYSNDKLLITALCFTLYLALCFALRSFGYKGIASTLAWLPAFPILGYFLFVLMFIILKPDMK